jgi:hypothetical protein
VRIVGQYYEFTGREFLINEVLPNFYFNVTAAYTPSCATTASSWASPISWVAS